MNEKFLNICQVSLSRDLPILKKNISQFQNIYKDYLLNFYIICPKKQKSAFDKIAKKNIKIISEESILSLSKFKKIFNKYMRQAGFYKKIQKRISWYYQQSLKLTFAFSFLKKNNYIIIWDSDTVLVKKINFFFKKKSILYCNVNEFFKGYYYTILKIFNYLPIYFLSSLNQFVAITSKEILFLEKKLDKFHQKKNLSYSKWIPEVIAKSVVGAHKNYNGSLFSEYELIGISNLLFYKSGQKIFKFLRCKLTGSLSEFHMKILRFLNFFHITYEQSYHKKKINIILKQKQKNLNFFIILISYLWKFYFRKILHIYHNNICSDKNKILKTIYR